MGMCDVGCVCDSCVSESPTDPAHYHSEIQPIDFMRGLMTRRGFISYCQGNVIKYVSRFEKKGGTEDLEKAQVYLQWMIEAEQL